MNREKARQHIKELIDKAGSLTAFANSIDRRPGNVGDWLNTKRNSFPNYEALKKICDIYNVTEAWLVGDTEEKREVKTEPQPQKPEPEKAEPCDDKLNAIIVLLKEEQESKKEIIKLAQDSQKLAEKQQEAINNLTQTLLNLTTPTQQEEHQEKIGGVRKAPSRLRFPEQSPRER